MRIRFLYILILINIYNSHICKSQDSLQLRKKIGLVLSGGGAKGIAHIGVLKVLDEAGIKIDYIGGTSMGSIVGAMYAIGYSPDSMAKIIRSQQWDDVLTDKISRKILSIEEKEMSSRYFLSLPIKNRKLNLPEGIIVGQNVMKILTRLSLPATQTNDFRKFPIPFLCVAADMITGESVTLDHGFLPDALRASMSIPTIFDPVEIDGKLLVDGGLLNNMPVEEVLRMGADVIIAVDVQDPLLTKEELVNFYKIMEQSTKFLRKPANEKSRKLANLIIKPEIAEYEVYSFNKHDSLIARGEHSCKLLIDSIKALVGQQNINILNNRHLNNILPDSVYISEIRVEGLKKVSRALVDGKIKFDLPGKFSISDIENSIDRLYGSQYFEKVSYQLVNLPNYNYLKIRIVEKNTNYLKVGLHYDDDYKAGILINTTFRNIYKNGSILSLDVKLSENPQFLGLFVVDKGWKPGLYCKLDMSSLEVNQFIKNKKVASYTYSGLLFSLGIQSTIFNSYALGIGGQLEWSSLHNKVSPIEFENIDDRLFNIYSYLKINTFDKITFPNNGLLLYSEGKIISNLNNFNKNNQIEPFSFLTCRITQVNPIAKNLSMIPHFQLGLSRGDSIPDFYKFFLGGRSQVFEKGVFQFIGLQMMQEYGNKAFTGRLDLRYEFINNNYFTFSANIGKASDKFELLIKPENYLFGYGLTYSYDSLIGPIEFTLMKSNKYSSLLTYVNVGFWF